MNSKNLMFVFIAIVMTTLVFYFSMLSQTAEDSVEQASNPPSIFQPIIDLEDIFSVADVEQALMASARDNNVELIETWQSQIILVAREAGYRDQDIGFLSGSQGLEYLMFRGNRLLFQEAVSKAYRGGESLQGIFTRYPQASDLFNQTEQLFIQRDHIIQSIAQTLINASVSEEQAQVAALQIWRDRNAAAKPISP